MRNRLKERLAEPEFMRVADQFQQMMIFNMVIDRVAKRTNQAIDIVQSAAIELVAQLFAADAESVSSPNRASPVPAESGIPRISGMIS